MNEVSKNGYKAFYKGKQIEVHAPTSRMAQELAAAKFKAKKVWEVSVVLCEKQGEVVEHRGEEQMKLPLKRGERKMKEITLATLEQVTEQEEKKKRERVLRDSEADKMEDWPRELQEIAEYFGGVELRNNKGGK